MRKTEVIIKDTHRGLHYVDGVLESVLEAGRYVIKRPLNLYFYRRPKREILLIDVRERDLTIKGQEILTSDKVAVRVSIAVQYQVVDPVAAIHNVDNYLDRIYSDVQLAARRSLASMTLEDILTNRNKLSDDILADVKEDAAGYGVKVVRAAVKDLIFPGNLQQVMNRVLTAQRLTQASLIEAQAKAETDRLEAETRAHITRVEAEATAQAKRVQTAAELESATIYEDHPALLRIEELEALRSLGANANARVYVGFDKHFRVNGGDQD